MRPLLHLARLSIRSHLLLLVAAVALPLGALLVYNVLENLGLVLRHTQERLQLRARDVATTSAEFLRSTQSQMTVLAELPLVRALDPTRCDPLFAHPQTLFPRFTNIFTLDVSGHLICSGLTPRPGQPSRVDPVSYLDKLLQSRQFTVGEPTRGIVSGKWVITLAQPILDAQGQVIGMLGFAIDLAQLWPQDSYVGLPEDVRQRILNHQGVIIASSDDPQRWIGQRARPEVIERIRGQAEGVWQATDRDHFVRLYGFTRVPGFDWYVVSSITRDRVLADIRPSAIRAATVGLLIFVGALLLGLLVAWRVIRPVQQIAAAAKRVAAGDAAARAQPQGPTEIVSVANDFNQMLDKLALQRKERDAWSLRYKALLNSAHDIILMVDPSYRVVEANPAALGAYGYSADEIRQKTIHDLRAPRAQGSIAHDFEAAAHPQGVLFESEHRRKNGSLFPVEVSAFAVDIDGAVYRLSFIRDISERKRIEQELERLATTDALTGLANRRHFMLLAEQELSRAKRYGSELAVLMFDVDHFKAINDTYGHATGDGVLHTLGQLCRQSIRDIDVIGRLGGEEFALVLPETSQDQAVHAAKRLCQMVAAAEIPLQHGVPLRFTISVGVIALSDSHANLDTLLARADQAMYDAKRDGRNQARVYSPA